MSHGIGFSTLAVVLISFQNKIKIEKSQCENDYINTSMCCIWIWKKEHEGNMCMFEFCEMLNLQNGILPGKMGFRKLHPIFMLLYLPILTGESQDIFHIIIHKND